MSGDFKPIGGKDLAANVGMQSRKVKRRQLVDATDGL
jgi:hypothetical protein